MSTVINLPEAEGDLSEYVETAAAGEELIFERAGRPLAKLIPASPPVKRRKLGVLAGKIWEADDVWSKELDEQIAADFYGNDEKISG